MAIAMNVCRFAVDKQAGLIRHFTNHRKCLLRMRVRDRKAEHVVIAAAQRITNVRFVREGHCPAVELYTHTRGAAQVADILQQSV